MADNDMIVLTRLEKLGIRLVRLFLVIPLDMLEKFTSFFTRNEELLYSKERMVTKFLNVRQIQYINGSTIGNYRRWCAAEGLEPEIVELEDGARALWIGPRKPAQKLVLYQHGGGFVHGMVPGHFHITRLMQLEGQKRGFDTAAVALCYDLAPQHKYPTQLRQAIRVFEYILKEGFLPSDIVIAGESAGGNITLAILSHMLHPHPVMQRLPSLNTPIAGAVLISPWVVFRTNAPSWTQTYGVDCLNRYCLEEMGAAYYTGKPGDSYAEPLDAPKWWWEGLENVVSKVLVTAGTREGMYDDARAIAGVLGRTSKVKVTLMTDGHIHAGPVKRLQNSGKHASTQLLRNLLRWTGDVLESPY